MGQAEIYIFIILATLITFIFIGGTIAFVIQYRRKKLEHLQEKERMNKVHTQELLSKQILIQQQTMQDIGREIHDNVGQKLTLASIYTQNLNFQNKDQETKLKLTEIASIIDESLSELRNLSKHLTAEEESTDEWIEKVTREIAILKKMSNCPIHFSSNIQSLPISNTIQNFIIRIIQEFSQNSLKHADCSLIEILFDYQNQHLILTLKDNGKGFDLQQTSNGIGLKNMRKRAELIHADFDFKSEANEGTQLIVSIPINNSKN